MRLDGGKLLPIGVLLQGLLGALCAAVDARLLLLGELLTLLAAQRLRIVRLIPLAERHSVDGDDGALHESLGTHELVVGRVVHRVDDAGLARAA